MIWSNWESKYTVWLINLATWQRWRGGTSDAIDDVDAVSDEDALDAVEVERLLGEVEVGAQILGDVLDLGGFPALALGAGDDIQRRAPVVEAPDDVMKVGLVGHGARIHIIAFDGQRWEVLERCDGVLLHVPGRKIGSGILWIVAHDNDTVVVGGLDRKALDHTSFPDEFQRFQVVEPKFSAAGVQEHVQDEVLVAEVGFDLPNGFLKVHRYGMGFVGTEASARGIQAPEIHLQLRFLYGFDVTDQSVPAEADAAAVRRASIYVAESLNFAVICRVVNYNVAITQGDGEKLVV